MSEDAKDRVSAEEFTAAAPEEWHVEGESATADFACGSFTAAGAFAARVAALCDGANHHADISVRYPDVVRVSTSSHDVGGLSRRDVDLAQEVSAAHGV